MRVRLRNKRPTLHFNATSQSQHQTNTNRRENKTRASSGPRLRERARDGQILDWDAAKCVSVLASSQQNPTETSQVL